LNLRPFDPQSDMGRIWLSHNETETALNCDNDPRASQANSPNFRMLVTTP